MARETTKHRCARWRIAVPLAVALGAVVIGAERPGNASSLTLRTIAIDGSFSDWDAVLANAAQTTHDGDGSSSYLDQTNCATLSTDLDCPQTGGAGNDFLTFAWTYDPAKVYLYLERYGSTENGVDFFFVADVNRDLKLTGTDKVVHASWQPNKPLEQQVVIKIAPYVPASPSGDPIRCEPVPPATHCNNAAGFPVVPAGFVDGYKLAGTAGVEVTCDSAAGCEGRGGSGGAALELAIPWSAFGVPAQQPFYWHVVSSNNGSLASSADNIGAPGGGLGSFVQRGVTLEPDRSGAVLSPGQVSYLHTLTNTGNDADVFDLVATSSGGAQVEILDAGTSIATDLTGDGTWDSVAQGRDSDGDGNPDVALDAGASHDITIRITMPAGRSGDDVTHLVATSAGDPTVTATVTDTSHVGTPAFVPSHQAAYTVAGQAVDFRDTLLNGALASYVFDLTPDAGCAGYRLELARDGGSGPGAVVAIDADGDGAWDAGSVDPGADEDGDGLPDLGALANGESRSFYVLVTPPAGTAVGTSCTATIRAANAAGGAASAAHGVTVALPVTFEPDYRGAVAGAIDAEDVRVPAGATLYLPVLVRNAEAAARVYDLAVATSGGAGAATPRIWSDPDGDGNPSDGEVVAQTAQLARWGGTQHLVLEIGAGTAATGTLIVTTATATAVSGGASDTETSETVVGNLGAFRDPLRTEAAVVFAPCSTVYVEARGLAASDATRYALAWVPPSGSAPPGVSPWPTTARGTADAQLALAADAAPGGWSVRLTDGGVQKDSLPFKVSLSGVVAALTTDRDRYLPGDAVGVTSSVRNDGDAPLDATSLGYAGAAQRLRTGVDVGPGETVSDAFTFVLDPAAAPGRRTLTLGWQLSCGSVPFTTLEATFDVSPPPPAITSPSGGVLVVSTTPTIVGTASPGAGVIVSIMDPLGARVSPEISADPASGAWSYAVPDLDALSQGNHSATATQRVGGAESAPSTAAEFTVDTVPPGAPTISSPPDGTSTAATAISLEGIVDADTVSVALLEGGANVATAAPSSGTVYFDLDRAQGTYTWSLVAYDEAGNASVPSPAVTVSVGAAESLPPGEDGGGGCGCGSGPGAAPSALLALALIGLAPRRRGVSKV